MHCEKRFPIFAVKGSLAVVVVEHGLRRTFRHFFLPRTALTCPQAFTFSGQHIAAMFLMSVANEHAQFLTECVYLVVFVLFCFVLQLTSSNMLELNTRTIFIILIVVRNYISVFILRFVVLICSCFTRFILRCECI